MRANVICLGLALGLATSLSTCAPTDTRTSAVATATTPTTATTATITRAAAEPVRTPDGTGGTNHPSILDRDYVVLVSFDGFRHDYLDRFETPTFDAIADRGVRADALVPVFPSLTFPTHYSIATGMYPGRHGLVGNRFYDPVRDDTFNYRNASDTQDGSWWGGEPIWVTAERQGMVSAAFFFPGTEADIGGLHPTFWRRYDGAVPNGDRVETVLEWLRLPPEERPHLITLYFSLVDSAGHRLGPDASELASAVREADHLLGTLLAGLERLTHGDRVYLVVVSDHGMASLPDDGAADVLVRELLDLTGVRAESLGPAMSLHVGPSQEDQDLATTLRDTFNARVDADIARAFLRRDVPPHLQVRDNPRYGDVLLIPRVGWRIAFRPDRSPPAGMHGWDPTIASMHGVFLAQGPRIMAGPRIPAFESVHIFPWLAALLDLTPPDDVDGTLATLQSVLADR